MENKKNRVSIYLTDDNKNIIERYAKEMGISVSSFCFIATQEYIKGKQSIDVLGQAIQLVKAQ